MFTELNNDMPVLLRVIVYLSHTIGSDLSIYDNSINRLKFIKKNINYNDGCERATYMPHD